MIIYFWCFCFIRRVVSSSHVVDNQWRIARLMFTFYLNCYLTEDNYSRSPRLVRPHPQDAVKLTKWAFRTSGPNMGVFLQLGNTQKYK